MAKQVAEELSISNDSTDWLDVLQTCKPNIVSIAKSRRALVDPVKQALKFGYHVFND